MSYQPISCSLYDQLELLVMRRQLCSIQYKNFQGTDEEQQTRLVDLFSRNQQEFVRLEEGLEIRLDAVISVRPVS
jgi:Rho-binding antiterminator